MRICRAMAMFRPSFIALIMNLTPEDLIFMETCFQRTVLVRKRKQKCPQFVHHHETHLS